MISVIISIFFSVFFDQPADFKSKFQTEQLIVVTSDSWNKIEGKMNVYEYIKGKWMPVFKNIPIVTGKSGMAWGKGLHDSKLNK